MAFDPQRHHRRSIRLADYDYRQNGAYYVTLCTHDRECLFGEIDGDGLMRRNDYGEIVQEEWERTAQVRANVLVDAFVVMPNHVHGILVIVDMDNPGMADGCTGIGDAGTGMAAGCPSGAGGCTGMARHAPTTFGKPLAGSLAAMVGAFKSAASRRINILRETPGWTVWHRNYYERIIRNEEMLEKARRYIANNPARWAEDVNNPNVMLRR